MLIKWFIFKVGAYKLSGWFGLEIGSYQWKDCAKVWHATTQEMYTQLQTFTSTASQDYLRAYIDI